MQTGDELADLGNILSLKDSESDKPEWRARNIFCGDCPRAVTSKTEPGRNRYSPAAKNADAWSATTADHAAARLALAYSLVKGFSTYTRALSSAYLQAEAGGRTTYVKTRGPLAEALPQDFKDQRSKFMFPVHRLQKALYGRKRSGFDWAQKLQDVLGTMGVARMLCRRLHSSH